MGELFSKIIFFLFVLPAIMFRSGYDKLKAYMEKHNLPFDWLLYVLLAILLFILILLLLAGFRY